MCGFVNSYPEEEKIVIEASVIEVGPSFGALAQTLIFPSKKTGLDQKQSRVKSKLPSKLFSCQYVPSYTISLLFPEVLI